MSRLLCGSEVALKKYGEKGAEETRQAKDELYDIENSLKSQRGQIGGKLGHFGELPGRHIPHRYEIHRLPVAKRDRACLVFPGDECERDSFAFFVHS